MENVRREMERKLKTRMQLLREFCDVDCVVSCSGQWLECAKETLERNNYETGVFTETIKLLLQMGQGKYRDIYITGPAKSSKSFILNPLTVIYRVFAQNTFAWIRTEKAKTVYLNNLKRSDKLIPRNDFLQLLEGAKIHLAVPKNHSSEDIRF